jgi:tellurite resistance protein
MPGQACLCSPNRIGQHRCVRARYGFHLELDPKVYEITKVIQADLEKVTLQATEVDEVKEQVLTKMETLAKNFHGLHKFTQDNLAKISQNLGNIEAKWPSSGGVSSSLEYRRLLDRLRINDDDVIERHTKDIGKGDRAVAKLDSEVATLKRKFASIEGTYGNEVDLESTRYTSMVNLDNRVLQLEDRAIHNGTGRDSGDKMGDINEKINELGNRMDKAEAQRSDVSFVMEDFNFASYGDFAQFMLNSKIPSCGMFWDIFSTLVSMCPKGQSGKERADEQHSSERINTSMLKNNLPAAMGHARPSCLYASMGGTGILVTSEKGFGACPTYEKWCSGVESVQKMLTKQLKDFTTGVNGSMMATDGGFAVAKQLLTSVREQWYDLVSWIDEFYKQLTEEANFKDEPA